MLASPVFAEWKPHLLEEKKRRDQFTFLDFIQVPKCGLIAGLQTHLIVQKGKEMQSPQCCGLVRLLTLIYELVS